MAGKALPLFAAAAAALFLIPKKRKGTGPKVKSPENGDDDPNITLSGTQSGWSWRVRRVPSQPGFADLYFGEIKSPSPESIWIAAHDKGRSNPTEAKLLAWERIADEVSAMEQASFNWEPARFNFEAQLREKYPHVSLSLLDKGAMVKNGIQCHWAIMDILPPIDPGAYAGFTICPSINEQISAFSDSIPAIKKDLGIVQ